LCIATFGRINHCGKRQLGLNAFYVGRKKQDMTIMAQTDRQPGDGYRPEMDGETHEKTYNGFVEFTTISTIVVVCWVLALAIGGVKGAWITAIMGVVASGIAGAIGALAPSISWRAPAVVLVLMTLAFIFF
jgi:hypothetical protein